MKTIILTALLLTTIISKGQTIITGSIGGLKVTGSEDITDVNFKFIEFLDESSKPNPQSFLRLKDDNELDITIYYDDFLGKEDFDWGTAFRVSAYDSDGTPCKLTYVIRENDQRAYVLEYSDKAYCFFVDEQTRFKN
jgi:hypothetical protein